MKISPRSRTAELTPLLRDTCATVGTAYGHCGSLEFNAAGDNCVVPSDVAALLILIVTQAVTNAIKYSHPSGIPGKIMVSCCQDQEDAIVIRVIDDGVGLPEKFDPTLDGSSG